MPLLKGKSEIGHNIKEMEESGHPHNQAVAAALRTAGVPKARDMATMPSSGLPQGFRNANFSANDMWKGRRV
jgi:hypothetical protein